jgi:hypothetical protein
MNRRFTKLSLALIALVLGMVIAPSANAQEEGAAGEGPDFSLDFSLDFTTQYVFRGINQEDQGLIFQPGVEFGLNVYEAAGEAKGPSSVDFIVGIWNSVHDGPTGNATPGQGIWYEADVYFGLSATCGKYTADLTYTNYSSPGGGFAGDVDEISVGISYDDSGAWGKEDFALNPSVLVAFEINGFAEGTQEGIYLELGIEPGFELVADKVTLTFPIVLGLSLDDYYEDASGDNETFGYLDLGVVATVPMDFIPAKFGAWEASAGVHVLLLGDSNETINGGDDNEVIATFGIGIGF